MTFSTNTCKYCFDIVIFLVVDTINPLSSDWLLSSGKSMNKILLYIICSGSQKSIARSRKDFLNTFLQQDCSSTFLGRPSREWEKDGGLNCGNASIWEPAEENKARGRGEETENKRRLGEMGGGAWWAAVHGVAKSQTRLSNFTFSFHFHALEKEMATHSGILA